MIINYTDVMKPHWESRKKEGINKPFNFTPNEYMKVILDAVNKQCSEGYRFNGIISSPVMNSGGAFLFEKTDSKFKYVWKFDDEIIKYVDIQRRKGGIPNDYEIVKLYNNMGDIHAVLTLPEISERKIFFIAAEEEAVSSDDTLTLYNKYEKHTGKRSVWQGKETKGFIEWKDMYDRNQLSVYER